VCENAAPLSSSTDTVLSYHMNHDETLLAYRRESQMSPAATLRKTAPAGSPIHGFLFKTPREAEIDVTLCRQSDPRFSIQDKNAPVLKLS